MIVFFDTEFTGLGMNPRLISIGLISEDGASEFYAELSDTYRLAEVEDFARKAVLPFLEGGNVVMTMQELTLRLGNWIQGFDEAVQLATDSLSWDWPWIQEIFRQPDTWPENLASEPFLLTMNYLKNYDSFSEALEKAFKDGLRQHHALDDAKANRLGWIASFQQ